MDDLLSEFLTETSESIATLDVELVQFEQDPNDKAILSNIFRLVHTIKGTCGFLGLPRLESLAHAGENVLGKIREGVLDVSPNVVSLIFQCLDQIKEILTFIESNEVEPEGEDGALIAALNAMADGTAEEQAPAEIPPVEEVAPVVKETEQVIENASAPVVEEDDEDSFPVAAELLAEVEAAYSQGKKAASLEEIEAEMEAERNGEKGSKPAPAQATAPVPAAPAKKAVAVTEKKEGSSEGSSISNQSIRVSVDLLELLMNQASELVLVRNQLMQRARAMANTEGDLSGSLQRLSLITTELQEGVMKTRMQPIGNAWAKLPRIVRDLALETGKKLDLIMLGADTELDRQVLELIKDPLTHMVRNSADHGVEGPAERVAAGKPELGTITLNAFHEGGHIIIEIKDDGRGLNIEKIKEKAIMNNLATEAELDAMSDQQIGLFIFKAGFSTAEKITSVSGRGVGMDVVRTNIDKIGGNIEVKTVAGKGSTFIIKIPLTLAIVSALIVSAGGERFAIPQISVLELVRVSSTSEQQVEMINDALVLRLRDRLLPLVKLSSLLKLDEVKEKVIPMEELVQYAEPVEYQEEYQQEYQEGYEQGYEEGYAPDYSGEYEQPLQYQETDDEDETFIVVSQVGTYSFGIVVDKVYDTEEIVVKPVSPILRDITMFSGNTILGDGSVIMILDPNGIASASGEIMSEKTSEITHDDILAPEKTSILIFRPSDDKIMAVPLGLVARLEDIDVTQIEYSYGNPVIQYRGHLMPLLKISEDIEIPQEGRQAILVFNDQDKSMGLVVKDIVDIVEDFVQVEIKADVPGTIGSAIIKEKAMDVIDIGYYLTQAFGDWFGGDEKVDHENKWTLLFVDDSAFFRNLLTPVLSANGYNVITAPSAVEALKFREKGVMFDAILSDIEMPEMSGIEFAEDIRSGGIWKDLPLIALSSHAKPTDLAAGNAAGFDKYVAKFDRDNLVKVISELISLKTSVKMLSSL